MVRRRPVSTLFPYTTLFRSRFTLERETLKLVVQHPAAIAPALGEVSEEDFTHPAYRAVWAVDALAGGVERSEEHTSELQSHVNLVCRLLLEKKNGHSDDLHS